MLTLCLLAAQCRNPLTFFRRADVEPTSVTTPDLSDPATDLLDVVKERGYLKVGVRVWPDANFNPPLARSPLGGLFGYEVDLAWVLADGLGVGLEMAEADPRRLQAGDWQGEYDLALAWLPITDDLQPQLIFSVPYAYDRAWLVVHRDNETIPDFDSLTGKRVGVPVFSLYEQILIGQNPTVQGQAIAGSIPAGIDLHVYNRDGNAIRDLAEGDGVVLDAVIHSQLVLQTAIVDDLMPLKQVGEPLLLAPIGAVYDRSGMPSEQLRIAVDDILSRRLRDGTLADISLKWYEEDISVLP
jgi:ABC-type amino acid transport substrate-binding protein